MGNISPRTRAVAEMDVGALTIVTPSHEVVCDHCRHTVSSAIGLVEPWQPITWTCATCLRPKLEAHRG